jgi:hypothetical protein
MSSKKLLVTILLAVVLARPMWSLTSGIFWKSTEELQAEIDETLADIEDASDTLDEARMARNDLKPVLERCLPEPESTAAALFQKWIYESATAAGLRDTVATVGELERDSDEALCGTIAADIVSTGTLSEMSVLLHTIAEDSVNQRVRDLEITPLEDGSGLAKFEYRVEALTTLKGSGAALPSVAATLNRLPEEQSRNFLQPLFPNVFPAPPAPAPVVVQATTPPPVAPAPVPVSRPRIAPSPLVLVGTVMSGSEVEAMFFDPEGGATKTVVVGDEIQSKDFKARIMAITNNSVMLRMSAGITEIRLSQALSSIPQLLWNPELIVPAGG